MLFDLRNVVLAWLLQIGPDRSLIRNIWLERIGELIFGLFQMLSWWPTWFMLNLESLLYLPTHLWYMMRVVGKTGWSVWFMISLWHDVLHDVRCIFIQMECIIKALSFTVFLYLWGASGANARGCAIQLPRRAKTIPYNLVHPGCEYLSWLKLYIWKVPPSWRSAHP